MPSNKSKLNNRDKTLVFLDIDGTLLKPDYSTNTNNVNKWIELLSEKGYLFCLNSNRSMNDLLPIIRKFNINGPVIGENGAFYFYKGRRRKLSNLPKLGSSFRKQISQLAGLKNATVEFADTVKKISSNNTPNINLLWSVNKYREWTASIHVIRKGKKDYLAAQQLSVLLKKVLGSTYDVKVSKIFCNVLIYTKKIDKGRALKILKQKYFSNYKLIMIGDDYADAPTISVVDKFYAVGNADNLLRRKSDYVAKYNYTKGVDEILKLIYHDKI